MKASLRSLRNLRNERRRARADRHKYAQAFLPSICRASSPTANILPVFMSLATTEGSRKTMPFPFT